MHELEMHVTSVKGFLPGPEVTKEVCRILSRDSKAMSDKLGYVFNIFT